MVPALSLWLPVVLSAVFVFIVSSVIHMVLKYHGNDMKALPKEDEVMDALQPFNIAKGEYFMPYISDLKQRESEEFKARLEKGPVAFLTVVPDAYNMGGKLFMWFVYSLLVGFFTAYVAGIAMAPGAHYLAVFRITGAVAFVGYALALMQNSIWFGKSWASTLKYMVDGFVYALVTAGTFGWLWP
ncbi:MAG: hypothetical protein OQJ84_09635 [Xanthomonadales bacterium]|nr:hypothetical protein [Xanthomonadales bacterium]